MEILDLDKLFLYTTYKGHFRSMSAAKLFLSYIIFQCKIVRTLDILEL